MVHHHQSITFHRRFLQKRSCIPLKCKNHLMKLNENSFWLVLGNDKSRLLFSICKKSKVYVRVFSKNPGTVLNIERNQLKILLISFCKKLLNKKKEVSARSPSHIFVVMIDWNFMANFCETLYDHKVHSTF